MQEVAPENQSSTMRNRQTGRLRFINLMNRAWWFTVSKALDTSSAATHAVLPPLEKDVMILLAAKIA